MGAIGVRKGPAAHPFDVIGLHSGGKTYAQVAREAGITRQAIQQRHGKGIEKERDASWWAHRYKHPELANKDWLKAALVESKGAAGLARQLGDISAEKIKSQAARLLVEKNLCNSFHYTEILKGQCEVCGKEMRRPGYHIRRPGQAFLCSRECYFKWARTVLWPRRHKEMEETRRQKAREREKAAAAIASVTV